MGLKCPIPSTFRCQCLTARAVVRTQRCVPWVSLLLVGSARASDEDAAKFGTARLKIRDMLTPTARALTPKGSAAVDIVVAGRSLLGLPDSEPEEGPVGPPRTPLRMVVRRPLPGSFPRCLFRIRSAPWPLAGILCLLQVDGGPVKSVCGRARAPQDEPTRPAARAEATRNGHMRQGRAPGIRHCGQYQG